MNRRAPLRQKTRLRPVNPRRQHKRQQEQFGPHATTVRAMACCSCGAPPPSDPHHVRSRGAGGKASDLVPLCRRCHAELHQVGRFTFEHRNRVSLGAIARMLWGEA